MIVYGRGEGERERRRDNELLLLVLAWSLGEECLNCFVGTRPDR